MTQKIKWIARDEYAWEVAERPFPISQSLPDWWKNMTPYHVEPKNPEGKKLFIRDLDSNATFKKCTPMLDALITGYAIPLWADVQVRQSPEEIPSIFWKVRRDVFQLHGVSSDMVPPPPGYTNTVVKFMNLWIPKTPPGYSTLVTSPFGYRDGAFLAIPAIVDTDVSTLEVLCPMWIKSGFEGIVEKGTPLVQMIPFKRDDWNSEFSYLKNGEYDLREDKNFRGTIVNHYVKNHWKKKGFK